MRAVIKNGEGLEIFDIFKDVMTREHFINQVAQVEERVFKDGVLKEYVLFFGSKDTPYGKMGTTLKVPAHLVEVL